MEYGECEEFDNERLDYGQYGIEQEFNGKRLDYEIVWKVTGDSRIDMKLTNERKQEPKKKG